MSLTLRYMRADDIQPVTAIDSLSFTPPWSKDSYAFEINQSQISHMAVLEEQPGDSIRAADVGWRRRLSGWLKQERPALPGKPCIVGYGGLWKMDIEAHISTIAIHPDYRRRGFGEILLAGMFGKALRLNARYIVLEVRVSNQVAQRLYRKYGFIQHGRKKNYYRRRREDAYDMRVSFDAAIQRRFAQRYRQLRETHRFRDEYSRASHPRR